MTTPVTFTLTLDDLTVPRHSNGSCCAIARAATRALGSRFTWVTMEHLVLDGWRTKGNTYFLPGPDVSELPFPEHVVEWNRAFVAGRPVEPIAFVMDIPDAPIATP